MSSLRELRATRTRALATTAVDPTSVDSGGEHKAYDRATLPQIDDIVGLHYRLVRLIGEGNFGKVYAAERIDVPEHQVAIKILPRALYSGRNVERELVMLATVGHPNMVQMKDHGMTESYVWLTMPIYEGETLEQRLENGPLTMREAYDIFLPIARALEALHQAGLRHQDVKPDNIFLARFAGRLHPVLLDLGVAAEKDSTFIAGTALYAAPEQLLAIIGVPGAIPLSEKMDTYCFGTTLLMALVGEKRFPGAKARTRDEIVECHEQRSSDPLFGALPALEGNPRELLAAEFRKWLALDPLERPNISRVAEGLDVLLEPEREIEREEERAKEAQRRTLVRTRVGALVAMVLVIGLGGAALYKRQTLRLAGELERARQEGAKSFDKLDTCTESFNVEQSERKICEADRDHDRTEHEETLSAMSKTNDGCSAISTELREVTSRYTKEVATCREDLKGEKTLNDELAKSTKELNSERTELNSEKAECVNELQAKQDEAENLRRDSAACEDKASKCSIERDQCIRIGHGLDIPGHEQPHGSDIIAVDVNHPNNPNPNPNPTPNPNPEPPQTPVKPPEEPKPEPPNPEPPKLPPAPEKPKSVQPENP